MSRIMFARIVAIATSAITFAFLFIHQTFRLDNIFLVPDLLLCLALVVGAVLPRRISVVVLLAGFGAAAGIFSVSVASYAVRGEFGVASFVGILASVAMVWMLAPLASVKGE